MLLASRFSFIVLLVVILSACDSGGRSPIVPMSTTETVLESPPPLQGSPDPAPPVSTPAGIEVSQSETVMQTRVDAAPAQQQAVSQNYQTTSAVEAIAEENSTSDRYTAASSIQLIYRAG